MSFLANKNNVKDVIDDHAFEPACFARHLGLWLADPIWFGVAVDTVVRGGAVPHAASDERGPRENMPLYALTGDGVAVVPMFGAMSKGESKFGGVNSMRARRAIATAVRDTDVDGIMLHIDSPGGMVSATDELATEVRAASQRKPIVAHIDDLGASAAYWVASQADFISMNRMGRVGSIGVYAVLTDSSARAERDGLKVHVIATGDHKGAGVPGTEVTPEHLAEYQATVDAINDQFIAAVSSGRGMAIADVQTLATGQTWFANEAVDLGLIDGVMSLETAYARLIQIIKGTKSAIAAQHRANDRGIELARMSAMYDRRTERSQPKKQS